MTVLLAEPLVTTLEQDINLKNNYRYSIGCIAPYIYLYAAPAGTFTLSIIKNAVTVFSSSFTSSDIKTSLSTTDNYAHVFYPIVPTNPIQLDHGLYTIRLSSSGYTAATNSFIGWIRQHEDLNNTLDYVTVSDDDNPRAIRLKVFSRGIN